MVVVVVIVVVCRSSFGSSWKSVIVSGTSDHAALAFTRKQPVDAAGLRSRYPGLDLPAGSGEFLGPRIQASASSSRLHRGPAMAMWRLVAAIVTACLAAPADHWERVRHPESESVSTQVTRHHRWGWDLCVCVCPFVALHHS